MRDQGVFPAVTLESPIGEQLVQTCCRPLWTPTAGHPESAIQHHPAKAKKSNSKKRNLESSSIKDDKNKKRSKKRKGKKKMKRILYSILAIASIFLSSCGAATGALPKPITLPNVEAPPVDAAPIPFHFQVEGETAGEGEKAEPDFSNRPPEMCFELARLMAEGKITTVMLNDGLNLFVSAEQSSDVFRAAQSVSVESKNQLVGTGKYYLYDQSKCGNLDTLQDRIKPFLG